MFQFSLWFLLIPPRNSVLWFVITLVFAFPSPLYIQLVSEVLAISLPRYVTLHRSLKRRRYVSTIATIPDFKILPLAFASVLFSCNLLYCVALCVCMNDCTLPLIFSLCFISYLTTHKTHTFNIYSSISKLCSLTIQFWKTIL